jgi:hypothetical protein
MSRRLPNKKEHFAEIAVKECFLCRGMIYLKKLIVQNAES